jgi:hypothetical protein
MLKPSATTFAEVSAGAVDFSGPEEQPAIVPSALKKAACARIPAAPAAAAVVRKCLSALPSGVIVILQTTLNVGAKATRIRSGPRTYITAVFPEPKHPAESY